MTPGRRVDTIHAAIRDGWRDLGFAVHDISQCPGALDLIVGAWGRLFWLEVKRNEKAKLTPSEEKVFDVFAGYPVLVVTSVEDAVRQMLDYVEGE